MKHFSITLLFVFVLAIKGYCNDSTRLSVNIRLIKEYFVPYDYSRPLDYVPESNDSLKEKKFDIEISLNNNSDSAISIWLMSCSWEENFLINNVYIYFKGWRCSKNIPTVE